MKVFIIEDEIPALVNLKRLLKQNFKDVEFVGEADSVVSSVEWLRSTKNEADIIFMDVELSDGVCFEIFKQVDVTSHVIITTAYDNYAIKAFKVHSVDYLLKPIDAEELVAAVERCMSTANERGASDIYRQFLVPQKPLQYKQRFIVKIGDKILVVRVEDIAYFISRDKTTYLYNHDGKSYIIDQSLDMVENLLDPVLFFRISRSCITHISSIKVVNKHFSGRLKVSLEPKYDEDVFVARVRTTDFMHWLNQ